MIGCEKNRISSFKGEILKTDLSINNNNNNNKETIMWIHTSHLMGGICCAWHNNERGSLPVSSDHTTQLMSIQIELKL